MISWRRFGDTLSEMGAEEPRASSLADSNKVIKAISRNEMIEGSQLLHSHFFTLFDVIAPLRQHPSQRYRTHDRRASDASAPLRSPEDQPLAEEMRKSQYVSPDRDLVHLRILNMIRSISEHNGQ